MTAAAFDLSKRRELAVSRSSWRVGFGERVRNVIVHPGFVELSNWPDMREPWAIRMRLGDSAHITNFHGNTLEEAVNRALLGIELLGRNL